MEILDLPLARNDVDRAAHHRAHAQELWTGALFIHFDGSKFLLDGNSLAKLSLGDLQGVGEKFYLGEHENQHYFLWCSAEPLAGEERYETLRNLGHILGRLDIGLAVHGQGLAEWHHRTPFCALCASPNSPALAGAVRRCAENSHESYPRTDPAIIVLAKDQSNRILLGRQKVWPEFRFSTFAGFVETGESFEAALARELFEEAGVHLHSLRYLGSQPWPFPQSLMVAFEATISDPEAARPDGDEIEEIRWFDHDSILRAVQEGTLLLPPSMSVARAMINAWYGDDRPPLETPETWRN